MTCARVAFAGGHGLCLQQAGPVAFNASVLGPRLNETKKLRLNGLPSRTRISPDGRTGTVTAFVRGHSYITSGAFSTRTSLIDLNTGAVKADLERFSVTRNGRAFNPADRNFWGVTFAADNDTFYATMATGGVNYLIKGSIRDRKAETVREQVECPSISPDGTRIAYKHLERLPAGVGWRLHVYDLRSGRDTPLTEDEGIDDQASWLDDGRVLYAKKDDTWVVPADGHGAPSVWMRNGVSPVIVRP
jgi:Tol biopolymer transport system component